MKNSNRMARHNDLGQEGERACRDYLTSNGYTIREYNWRPSHSHKEIDIIAQKDSVLAFVEVKTRRDSDPAEAMDAKKIRNLVKGAELYLQSLPYDLDYRFDVMYVKPDPDGLTWEIEHLEDAFMPPLS